MKLVFIFLILMFFLISCSSNTEQSNSNEKGLIEQSQYRDTTSDVDAYYLTLSDELKKTIDSLEKIGYTNTIQINSDENFFGLLDANSVFANAENDALDNCTHNLFSFVKMDTATKKSITWASLDEFIFENETKSKLIEDALGKPLIDKTKERFLRHPLIFFRWKNRMYYVSTTDEKYRDAMNEVNGILVNFLSPEQ